jgi:transposase
MDKIICIGIDTSKHVFQMHGVNAGEKPALRKKMRRKEMVDFFTTCPPTLIAIEACGGSHHWARLLTSFGHEVKMIAPQLAKPYVKRNKMTLPTPKGCASHPGEWSNRCHSSRAAIWQGFSMVGGTAQAQAA